MVSTLPNQRQIELAIRSLPAPLVLAQLLRRLSTVDVDVSEIAAIVRRDTGITGVLIGAANSAAYCGFEAATTAEDAVARVGFRETYRLVGQVASGQLANRPLGLYGVSASRLRQNSLFCAIAMEEVAGETELDSGTAYTVGLLRSIGKVVLDSIRFSGTQPFDFRRQSFLSWETGNWLTTSAEVTARAMDLWGFPATASAAVLDHVTPGLGASRTAWLLHAVSQAAHEHGVGLPGESRYGIADAAMKAGLSDSVLAYASERAADAVLGVTATLA